MIRLVLPAFGAAILFVLAWDVFSTVFSPQGRGGPLHRRQNPEIWRLFRRLGRIGGPARRSRWFAHAGPTMVVSTVCVWVFLLVLGFALIYYPWIESFLVTPGSLRIPWVEALYYSGYTAATLGLGDVVADSNVLRILAPVQALFGFALLSVSVTYVLSVYRELIRKQALAARIDSYFGGEDGEDSPASGLPDGLEPLARWCESITVELGKVLLAHYQYPVLHYFRSARPWQFLPLQLQHLLDVRGEVRSAEDSQPLADLARHPSYRGLQNSLEKYVQEMDAMFSPAGMEGPDATEEAGDPLERAHRRLLRYLNYS